MSTIFHLILWYIVFSVSGMFFWLVFNSYFDKLIDKGYALSKFISLSIIALFLWTCGFVLHLPINFITIWIVYIGFCLICLSLILVKKISINAIYKNIRAIIYVELVFFFTTCLALYIISIHPVINNETERMMDFQILNVLITNVNLPAKDLWFSGGNINYYYFGSFFLSLINKMTNTNSLNGYLYSLGFIYSISSTIIFTIGASLTKKWWMGIVAILMTMIFSNFDYIFQNVYKFWKINQDYKIILTTIVILIIITLVVSIVKNIKHKKTLKYLIFNLLLALAYFFVIDGVGVINQILSYFFSTSFVPTSFWDNSRVIPYSINEFPYYSLIIGDLHPHYIDIMFFVSNLALFYLEYQFLDPVKISFLESKSLKLFLKNKEIRKYAVIKFLSLIIFACAVATNSWELIVVGLFFGVKDIFYIVRSILYKIENKLKYIHLAKLICIPLIFDAIVYIGGYLIQTPYFLSVTLPVAGIKLNTELSPIRPFLILYIFSFIFTVIGLTYLINKFIRLKKFEDHESFMLSIFVTAIVIVIFSEFFFVSDLFYFDNFVYRRANTIFKVNYLGFILFGIGATWVIYLLIAKIKFKGYTNKFSNYTFGSFLAFFKVSFFIAILITLTYLPKSILDWAIYHQEMVGRYTLNADKSTKGSIITFTNFAKQTISVNGSDLIEATNYLKIIKNDNDVLIEAPGEAYQFTSIGSSFSTMPSVIGWVSHEAQWRKYTNLNGYINSFEKSFNPTDIKDGLSKEELLRKYLSANVEDKGRLRETDVNNFYNFTGDWSAILHKYNVTYIWYGPIERVKYSSQFDKTILEEDHISKVFSNKTIDIYKHKL